MFYVYALIDPLSGRIHYVGMTGQHPQRRLSQHMKNKGKDKGVAAKSDWIEHLRGIGEVPNVAILASAQNKEEALEMEAHWISMGGLHHWPLYNNGGGSYRAPRRWWIRLGEFLRIKPPTNTTESMPAREDGQEIFGIEPPFDITSHSKRDVILWWSEHIGGSQAECRRWAALRGIDLSKGYVSDTLNGKYSGTAL